MTLTFLLNMLYFIMLILHLLFGKCSPVKRRWHCRKLPSSAESDRKRLLKDRDYLSYETLHKREPSKTGHCGEQKRQRQRLELYPFAGSVPKSAVGRQVFNITL